MDFCILVLSYNHPELTARAVQSCLPFATKIILIHNGSEQKNVLRLRHEFPQITHLEITENRGYSGGVNAGFDAALEHFAHSPSGGWVFLLTNDCTLVRLTPPQAGAPRGLRAPQIYRRKLGKMDSAGGCFIPAKAQIFHLTSSAQRKISSRSFFYIPGSAFWIHTEAIHLLEGMDEALGTYWEDVDLSVRAAQKQIHMDVDLETEILHQVGKTNHKKSYYTTYLFQRNRRIVSRRYCPPWTLSRIQLELTLAASALSLILHFVLKGDHERRALFQNARRDS